jgi:signal transduction histidine kinase
VLSSSLEYRDVVQQVARVCAGTLADYCIVHVREGGGSARALGVAHADPTREEMVRGLLRHFPVDPEATTHPVVQALRTGRPELAADVNEGLLDRMCTGPEHREMLLALGLSSAMVVPIRAKGETLGTISLACTGGSPYDAGDLAVAEEVARRAALAVENARLYQEARQAVRAREEVVAVVSHDLRNPINAVMLAATVLEEFSGGRLDETDRKQVGVIRRSAEQMNALVQDLVEVAAFESGEMPMQRRPILPGVLATAAEEMFGPLAGERGISLTCHTADGLPAVSADYGRVLQLFSNLVGNALKFTPAGGAVEIGAVRAAGFVRFWVRDTGPGIERDHLPRLFDRFWQAQRGRGAGAGLGLAIARSIVEGHGGQIWAESEAGQGSTFHFTIPVAST